MCPPAMPEGRVLGTPSVRGESFLETVNNPCFVCGGDQSEVRYRPEVGRWGYTGPFVLRRCLGCGLVYNSPRLPQDELAELYRRNYYFFDRQPGAEITRIGEAYLRTIAHLPTITSRTLLEVGSGKGYMLALLARLGWHVVGVEIAEIAARHSRQCFGVPVFTGTLEAFRRANQRTFDVVLAQDVLEHVPDPAGFLDATRASLRPGGWLIIDTPNVGGRNVGALGEGWRGFNPFHIYLFDRYTLGRALAKAGFTVHTLGSYNEAPQEARSAHSLKGPSPLSSARALIRRGVDRALLGHYLRRVVRRGQRSLALPLDPECGGDNLVCIAEARESPA